MGQPVVAVIVMVIVHHAAQPYGPTGRSPVTDAAQSDWFRPFYTVNAAVGLRSTVSARRVLRTAGIRPQGTAAVPPRTLEPPRGALVAFAFAVNPPLTLAYEQPHSFGDFLGSLYHDVLTPF